MAVLAQEAYNAGFNAAGQNPPIPFDTAWAAFDVGGIADRPITLKNEFKRGWSSAMSYRMAAY